MLNRFYRLFQQENHAQKGLGNHPQSNAEKIPVKLLSLPCNLIATDRTFMNHSLSGKQRTTISKT
ncbi:hypothetical protein [Bartonella sp. B1099]|uniref:hypothetical protein n=1 Tax=Bartonella sp. B1099 TaxID=2911422 RepID=UPI0020C32509|nr:hypothetical protein [Bartonella sp. B1099]